jgi:PAS domain S-box-containing protein
VDGKDRRALRRALAEVLRELRISQPGRWSQNRATRETGVDVGGLERAERDPVVPVLWPLAQAYRTTPSRLVRAVDKRYRALRGEGDETAAPSRQKELDQLCEIAATSPLLAWVANGKQVCVYTNQAMLTFTGKLIDELLGKGWLQLMHPEDQEQNAPAIRKAWKRREAYSRQFRFLQADGAYVWVAQTAVPYFTRGGAFVGYLGTMIPTTEEQRVLIRSHPKPKPVR